MTIISRIMAHIEEWLFGDLATDLPTYEEAIKTMEDMRARGEPMPPYIEYMPPPSQIMLKCDATCAGK